LARAVVHDHEVVVLDRDLPAVHGDEVCRRLVAAGTRSRVPMLTGAGQDQDLIDGLALGADDYLPEPFAFAVLLARIAALARRAPPSIPPVLEHGDEAADRFTGSVKITISRLRAKLGDPGLIQTIAKAGYRI
jgi:DNA-binding response OmpR family regulator